LSYPPSPVENELNRASQQYENQALEYVKAMDLTHSIYQIFYHWKQTDDIQTEQKRMSEFMPKEVNQTMLEDTDIED